MTKRRLSQQQLQRIRRAQQNKRPALATDPLPTDCTAAPEATIAAGRVIAHYGKTLEVMDEAGGVHVCKLRQSLGAAVTGDWVYFQSADTGQAVVVQCLDRSSVLQRITPAGIKTLAANIDQMIIVVALKPATQLTTIDRYLIAAEMFQIAPLIVLNKADLLDDHAPSQALLAHLEVYQGLGIPVHRVSTQNLSGMDKLQAALKDRTSIFIGLSGVGKSSLSAKFLPEAQFKIGAIASKTSRGTHTTTTARWYRLAQGGQLIDSPGIRDYRFSLVKHELARHFIEFKPYLGHCRFRNCLHREDAGCAVLAAVKAHQIHPLRLASYHELSDLAEVSR